MSPGFVHLHLHSEYSLVDGVVRLKPLVNAVAEAGMPAVAVTDQSNMFAMVKFYRAAMAAGVKPVIGVELWVRNPEQPTRPWRLLLLCKNRQGYKHLTELVSRSYLQGQHQSVPMLDQAWLEGSTGGLIALHFRSERNHQGNRLLGPIATASKSDEPIRCRERLGGMLNFYHREAA